MEQITPGDIATWVLAVASALVLLGNAAKTIAGAWKAAKAPDTRQNERLTALEDWKKEVDRKLSNDYEALQSIQGGLQASYQAQLALLDHGIDGNNIKQMQDAKEVLQHYLIQK